MLSEDVKTKHMASVKCPECGTFLDILERETIITPYRKKVSEKEIMVRKSLQKTLEV